ncbi:MAG: hypothetical protein IPK83_17820 [Planctomycetes bacterium]|nr:hypothetical protein [Planctomycetota bacterium]
MFQEFTYFTNLMKTGTAVTAMTIVLAGCGSFVPPAGLLNPDIPANIQHLIDNKVDFDVSSLDVSLLLKMAEPVDSANSIVGCWGWSYGTTIDEFAQFGEISGSSYDFIHFGPDGRFNSAMYTNTSFFSLAYVVAYEGTYRYVSPGVVELTATVFKSTDEMTGELVEEYPLDEPIIYENVFRIAGDRLIQLSADADENGIDRVSGDGAWTYLKYDCME